MYLAVGDARRADRSEEIVGARGVVSAQVLNEFVDVVRRKAGFDWQDVSYWLDVFLDGLEVVPLTLESFARAVVLSERFRLRIYDGHIIASAQLADCDVLFTEDLHDGLVIDGLTIRNPYA